MSLFSILFLFLLIWLVVLPLGRLIVRILARRRAIADMWRAARDMRREAANAWGEPFSASSGAERRGGWARPRRGKTKRFGRDVGEYVAFEELPPDPAATNASADNCCNTSVVESQVSDVQWEEITDDTRS